MFCIVPRTKGISWSGFGKGRNVPGRGYMNIRPCTVARVQELCACHQTVASSMEKMTSYIKSLPGRIGHCVMYSGPSDHGFLGCSTPCLCVYSTTP